MHMYVYHELLRVSSNMLMMHFAETSFFLPSPQLYSSSILK